MIIEVCCELDGDGVRAGGARIEAFAAAPQDMVLDLGNVSRMDSSGLGLLVLAQKRKLEQGKSFAIQNVKGQPLALLRRFKLLNVLGYQPPASVKQLTTRPAVA